CDSLNLDGSIKDPKEIRNGYTHAQKIRAAFTYGFNRIAGLGLATWEHSEVTGQMKGNPSVSSLVSSYMVSLRRRKVQGGEAATSARAITPVCMPLNFLDKYCTFIFRSTLVACMISIIDLSQSVRDGVTKRSNGVSGRAGQRSKR
ncbi:hypothetical protein F5876DRAFT_54272, partial [Lentinula aff. lateritia]